MRTLNAPSLETIVRELLPQAEVVEASNSPTTDDVYLRATWRFRGRDLLCAYTADQVITLLGDMLMGRNWEGAARVVRTKMMTFRQRCGIVRAR